MFLNNCLKVVGAAVTYFYGVFIEDFVVAVFLWEMLADQVQKFFSDVCLHVNNVNNVTLNTNFLFGTETIQTARIYQNTSGRSRTATQTTKLTGVF